MAEPLITNAADRDQLRDADVDLETKDDQERTDLAQMLAHPAGRRVLYRLLEDAHLFDQVFHTDALVMAHNAGEHDLGLRWSRRIEQVSPGALFKLMQTVSNERAAEDRARKARRMRSAEGT